MPQSPIRRSAARRAAALAAAALVGVLVLPGVAAAVPPAAAGTSSVPPAAAGTSSVPPAAAGTSSVPPAAADATATGRPVPPALLRALRRAAAARADAVRTGGPQAPRGVRASGIRPIPGSTLSTDLPTRIEVGTSITAIRFTIATPNDFREPIGVVTLLDDDQMLTQVAMYGTRPGQSTYRGAVAMDERTLTTRGTATWVFGVFDEADPSGEAGQIGFLDTTVKLRSLLAHVVTRDGDVVHLVGAAKSYSHDELYIAYPAHPVHLQRWTTNGWATIRTLRTDPLGHVSAAVRIPFTVGLRLWSPDTPTTFGAVTVPTVS